jgi:LPXTG-motif cell wall-anchored protein
VTTTQAGGGLPFTGAESLPTLLVALTLLGLGGASLLAGSRRRRRA